MKKMKNMKRKNGNERTRDERNMEAMKNNEKKSGIYSTSNCQEKLRATHETESTFPSSKLLPKRQTRKSIGAVSPTLPCSKIHTFLTHVASTTADTAYWRDRWEERVVATCSRSHWCRSCHSVGEPGGQILGNVGNRGLNFLLLLDRIIIRRRS